MQAKHCAVVGQPRADMPLFAGSAPRTCSFVLSAVEWMRTSVPRWDAVASSLPSRLSASAARPDECACTNLVRRTSYSSTRTCEAAACWAEAGLRSTPCQRSLHVSVSHWCNHGTLHKIPCSGQHD